METQIVESGAHVLSTFGLYTVITVLCLVIIYLYKRISDLERELRASMTRHLEDTTRLLAMASDAIAHSNETMSKFGESLADLRTAVNLAVEKMNWRESRDAAISGQFQQPRSFREAPPVHVTHH